MLKIIECIAVSALCLYASLLIFVVAEEDKPFKPEYHTWGSE